MELACRTRCISSRIFSNSPDDSRSAEPLLDFAAPVAGAHALIVARHAIDLMCALLRQGCAGAALQQLSGKPERSECDLVIFADLTPDDPPSRVRYLAKRVLVPTGRLIARITDRQSGAAALSLAGALRAAGFVAPRVSVSRGETFLLVELPAFRMVATG